MPTLEELAAYDLTGEPEQAVREQWIFPILRALGYGPATLNRIVFEDTLRLAHPVRKIGSTSYRVDYRPTVLGVGMWILEAKSPNPELDWETNLDQAWAYATHPEVNVPLMVMANGQRLAVHDLTRANWDDAIVDIASGELASRFKEIEEVLGARRVARWIRVRQLEHLRNALSAELDPGVLDLVRAEVSDILLAAKGQIELNQAEIRRRQYAQNQRTQVEDDVKRGIWALAQEINAPTFITREHVDRAIAAVMRRPSEERELELSAFRAATTGPGLAPVPFWPVRVAEVATAAALWREPGCEEWSEAVLADLPALFSAFPDDALASAAHRLERVLPVAAARVLTGVDIGLNIDNMVNSYQDGLDMESKLRWPLDTAGVIASRVTMACRRSWGLVRIWSSEDLNVAADGLERLVESLEYDATHLENIMFLPPLYGDTWRQFDPLPNTVVVALSWFEIEAALSDKMKATVAQFVDGPGDIGPAAQSLVDRF